MGQVRLSEFASGFGLIDRLSCRLTIWTWKLLHEIVRICQCWIRIDRSAVLQTQKTWKLLHEINSKL
ncbi:unnamed protein product [Caenorhabditis angaria]|uniref:Uncharacterized protein n=1 Tax=Caenorhabditis angaria TaxID=860376 RepID=A0A9P1MVS2_9PELO|nr:unnamed protein product [Caenorhabditis angaria]